MMAYLVALVCVVGIATGQILFKLCSIATLQNGSFVSKSALAAFAGAIIMYAITSVAWVWVLQKIELSRAYPFMAIAFVLVPSASYYLFGEQLSSQYSLGVAFIVLGFFVLSIR